MEMIDIANIYRRHQNPRRPFSYFFTSKGYKAAYDYLRSQDYADHQILIREMPFRTNPSVAKVHPLIATEFVRWLDYPRFARIVNDRLSTKGD